MTATAPSAVVVEPEGIDKAARFKRNASRRGTKAIQQIRLLGHTANTSTYEYTEEQVDKLIGTLRHEVDKLEGAFRKQPKQPVQLEL